MSEITLTEASRSALLQLNNTQELSGRTQGRLTTGKKVNNVLDDAVAFFQSKALSDRATDLVSRKSAMDQGVRYITQGNGSSVALALVDAVNKHNERNPGKEVIFLNHSAVDPDLTNSKCSYWHFRFDADTSMRQNMTAWVAGFSILSRRALACARSRKTPEKSRFSSHFPRPRRL